MRRLLQAFSIGIAEAGCDGGGAREPSPVAPGFVADTVFLAADTVRCLRFDRALLGLRLRDPAAHARALLLPTRDSVAGWDEDDGDRVPVLAYRFGGGEVDLVRGVVDRIRSQSPSGWPVGLDVGSTAAQVDSLASRHRLRPVAADSIIEPPVCDHAAHLTLHLARRTITAIELSQPGPSARRHETGR